MESNDEQIIKPTGCCPIFEPKPWDEQEHHWDNKLFLRRPIRQIFHIPINFASVITSALKTVQTAGVGIDDGLILSDERSAWRSDLMIEVQRELPGEDMVRLSGHFLSKVFEGPYKNIGRWISEMDQFVAIRGHKIRKNYFWYTTCPGCAKKYGKNYVVIFSQVV
ncbi:MAG: hydrolase [Patescibacteria group bacterium]